VSQQHPSKKAESFGVTLQPESVERKGPINVSRHRAAFILLLNRPPFAAVLAGSAIILDTGCRTSNKMGLSAAKIVLEYMFPGLGVIIGTAMFSAPLRDCYQRVVEGQGLQTLNVSKQARSKLDIPYCTTDVVCRSNHLISHINQSLHNDV